MPLNRSRHFAPLHAIAHRINNRRLAREERRTGMPIRERLAALPDLVWVELAEYVPPADADDLVKARPWVNPDVLPTPVRNALRGRCAHQRQALVLRYLQTGSPNTYVAPCACPEARSQRLSHPPTPARIVRPLSDSAWAEFQTGEYGGEG